jgi:hypothetical protein
VCRVETLSRTWTLDGLASDLVGVESLTCLWMLTPSDGSNQGLVTFVPDPELANLTAFFHDQLDLQG